MQNVKCSFISKILGRKKNPERKKTLCLYLSAPQLMSGGLILLYMTRFSLGRRNDSDVTQGEGTLTASVTMIINKSGTCVEGKKRNSRSSVVSTLSMREQQTNVRKAKSTSSILRGARGRGKVDGDVTAQTYRARH